MLSTAYYLFSVFSLCLTLAACGKYEAWGGFDNNCSGTGGYYEPGRCADYMDGP